MEGLQADIKALGTSMQTIIRDTQLHFLGVHVHLEQDF